MPHTHHRNGTLFIKTLPQHCSADASCRCRAHRRQCQLIGASTEGQRWKTHLVGPRQLQRHRGPEVRGGCGNKILSQKHDTERMVRTHLVGPRQLQRHRGPEARGSRGQQRRRQHPLAQQRRQRRPLPGTCHCNAHQTGRACNSCTAPYSWLLALWLLSSLRDITFPDAVRFKFSESRHHSSARLRKCASATSVAESWHNGAARTTLPALRRGGKTAQDPTTACKVLLA